MHKLFALAPVLLASGCAITQNVQPIAQLPSKHVCIVENPAVVQAGFIDAYGSHLLSKGYSVKRLAPDSAVTTCPVTSTYTANWRWDLALYMAYAQIKVFTEGKEAGQAVYDSLRGGANMGKFIRAEEKIKELVDQLFPKN